MSFEQTALLAAIAGATIFLGLPVGRLRNLSTRTQALLTTGAAGRDPLPDLGHPVAGRRPGRGVARGGQTRRRPCERLRHQRRRRSALSIGLGLLVARRGSRAASDAVGPRASRRTTSPWVRRWASAFTTSPKGSRSASLRRTGATAFALILVIGFALHNATEGFGIAAPLTTGTRPSWSFLAALGLVGGGPTFVGGVIGYSFVSPLLSIVFLGLAAGALVYVFNEMMAVSRKFAEPVMANVALLAGLLVAFGTDFLLVAAPSRPPPCRSIRADGGSLRFVDVMAGRRRTAATRRGRP